VGTSEEGENENDKWITVTGRGKHKNLLTPKLKPTLHNAFAILSKADDPTNYNMSGPTLKMDDDKTILPPDQQEHCRQQKIARRQHIKRTLRRLRDSDNLFLDDSITLAEDERTSLAKADNTDKMYGYQCCPHQAWHNKHWSGPTSTQCCLQSGLGIQPHNEKV